MLTVAKFRVRSAGENLMDLRIYSIVRRNVVILSNAHRNLVPTMNRLLPFVVWASLFGSAIGAAAEPKVAQRWALLVGVDDYANAKDLAYCGADQVALRKQLIAGGFNEDHIFLLHDRAEDPKYRPSQRNFERQLDIVLQLAEEDDLLIVGFSGHGVHINGKSFFCPSDALLAEPATLISMDSVYDRLKECSASFKLVLVDACRDDPALGGKRSFQATDGSRALARSMQESKLPNGVVLLNSCAPGEISWEEERFGHGVFMHYVLESLQGAGDSNGDGAVSLTELQAYVGPKTKTYVARQFNDSQRPFFKGDLTTEALECALLPVFGLAGGGTAPEPPKLGTTMTNSIGMKLTYIPAGKFFMGSSATARQKAVAELQPLFDAQTVDGFSQLIDAEPQHEVTITKPYFMSVYEVTQSQYEKVVGVNPSYCSQAGGGRFKVWRLDTNDYPVENVTYYDAVKFCELLSALPQEQKEAWHYRLPTEAEWEYACRAGTSTLFSSGDQMGSEEANYDGTFPFNGAKAGPKLDRSCRVGLYPKNAFGLYDMHGNVAEYCSDFYAADYYLSGPSIDPTGPATGTQRIVRGGAWENIPHYGRAGYRIHADPGSPSNLHGIRVVCVPK